MPPPAKQQPKSPRKRRPDQSAPSQTPSKRSRHAETPSKGHFHDEQLETTPSISRKLFSPPAVTSLGPTPQRDGRVLGLFDLLEEPAAADSPSRRHGGRDASAAPSKIHATPSKRSSTSDVEVTPRMGRTPMSASKRQYLNTFMSPLKNRDANIGARTPSKLHFDTPQFLKRHYLATVDENGEFDAPAPLRLPRKPLGRGLSEIVASLRKVEEDKADADLEALREMEAEEAAGYPRSPSKQPAGAPAAPATTRAAGDEQILVEDSQAQRLPLGGFDDEGLYDSPVEDEMGRDGNPMRIFKKKGQKRTTRRFNLKPVWTKRPAMPTEENNSDEEDVEGEGEERIPKTQLGNHPEGDYGDGNVSSDSEFGEGRKAPKKPKKASKSSEQSKEGPMKKAKRKVNELAHANFQRLKLRQGGAKGGPGYNSRFRRRR